MKEHFELTLNHFKKVLNFLSKNHTLGVIGLILYVILTGIFFFYPSLILGKESIWASLGTVLTVLGALIGVFVNIEANKKLAHYHRLQDKGEEISKILHKIYNSIRLYNNFMKEEGKNLKNCTKELININSYINHIIALNNIYDIIKSETINKLKDLGTKPDNLEKEKLSGIVVNIGQEIKDKIENANPDKTSNL